RLLFALCITDKLGNVWRDSKHQGILGGMAVRVCQSVTIRRDSQHHRSRHWIRGVFGYRSHLLSSPPPVYWAIEGVARTALSVHGSSVRSNVRRCLPSSQAIASRISPREAKERAYGTGGMGAKLRALYSP